MAMRIASPSAGFTCCSPRLSAPSSRLRPPSAPLRAPLVVRASSKPSSEPEDNPYHHREHTQSRRSNPGGTKDAGITHRDKDEQFAYQQERLEWRSKNQAEGIDDREEPPHTNMAHDYSAERRGPEVEGSSGHGDTLKELVDNLTGKKKKQHDDEDKKH